MPRGVKNHKIDTLDMMEFHVLRAVSRTVSMRDAAKLLNVTPPTVLYRIQLMENFFGQPLVNNNLGRLKKIHISERLTPFGRTVLQYTDQILDLYNEMMVHANSIKEEKHHVVIP